MLVASSAIAQLWQQSATHWKTGLTDLLKLVRGKEERDSGQASEPNWNRGGMKAINSTLALLSPAFPKETFCQGGN